MINNKFRDLGIDDNEGLPDTHPIYDDAIDLGFGERAAWEYGDRAEHGEIDDDEGTDGDEQA